MWLATWRTSWDRNLKDTCRCSIQIHRCNLFTFSLSRLRTECLSSTPVTKTVFTTMILHSSMHSWRKLMKLNKMYTIIHRTKWSNVRRIILYPYTALSTEVVSRLVRHFLLFVMISFILDLNCSQNLEYNFMKFYFSITVTKCLQHRYIFIET